MGVSLLAAAFAIVAFVLAVITNSLSSPIFWLVLAIFIVLYFDATSPWKF